MRIDASDVLAPYETRLEATRRPALSINLETMHQDDVMASKVGGQPYIPQGRALPRGADGRGLALLAQIDFAQMPRLAGYPDAGMLQVFVSVDDFYGANFDGPVDMQHLAEQKDFRVIYWPAPLAPGARVKVSAASDGKGALPFDPAKPRRMRFVQGSETITADDVGFAALVGQDMYALARDYASRHGVEDGEVEDALNDVLRLPGHKLGGYPYFTQQDPRKPADRQVLLLQLDTDEEMMWGDSGVANFFILPEDLARRDFSRVAYNWDCL